MYPARGKHQRGNPLLVFFEFYLFWSVRHRRLPTKGGYLLDCVLGRVKVSTLALDYSIATADYGSKSFTDSFKQEFLMRTAALQASTETLENAYLANGTCGSFKLMSDGETRTSCVFLS